MVEGSSAPKLKKILLLLILFGAFFVRFEGIWSEKSNPSEGTLRNHSYYMFVTGSLRPREFAYPSLYFYAVYGAEKIAHSLIYYFGVLRGNFYEKPYAGYLGFYTGRFLAALFGFLAVLLLYKAAKKIFNEEVALIATFFFSFFYLVVMNAHEAKPDSLQLLLVFFSSYLAYLYLEKGSYSLLLMASFISGLSPASKYMFISVVPVGLAILLRREKGLKTKIFKGLISAIVAFLGFFMGCPFCILDLPRLLETFTAAKYYFTGYQAPVSHPLLLALKDLVVYTGFIPGALFFLSVLKLKERKHAVLLSFPILYLLIIAFSRLYATRYLVFVLPYVALYASWFICRFAKKFIIAFSIAFLIFSPHLIKTFRNVHWFAFGLSNKEILREYVKSSLLPLYRPLAFHVYDIPSKKYFFARQMPVLVKRDFIVFGEYEERALSPKHPDRKYILPLKRRIEKRYCPILELKKARGKEFVFDYTASLFHKKAFSKVRCKEAEILFPLVVKTYNPNAEMLFPGNLYSRDLVVKTMKTGERIRIRVVSTKGKEMCFAVDPYKRTRYRVKFCGKKEEKSVDTAEVQCLKVSKENPWFDFLLKEGEADLLLFSLPIDAVLFASKKAPVHAFKILRRLRKDRFYSFESRRIQGELERKKDVYVVMLAKELKKKMEKIYRYAFIKGIDGRLVEKTQRVYLRFEFEYRKAKIESQFFYLLPGVYSAEGFSNAVLLQIGKDMKLREIPFSEGTVIVNDPGWVKVILLEEKHSPVPFLYFNFKKTLEWEINRILKGVQESRNTLPSLTLFKPDFKAAS